MNFVDLRQILRTINGASKSLQRPEFDRLDMRTFELCVQEVRGAVARLTEREREVHQLLLDIYPLARRAACVGGEHQPGVATSCCEWAVIVTRIEALKLP